jgi:CPA2 family monovalent cation:H+ antiporter-2
VGIAVAAALLVSLLFYRLGLPMIVGQLVAGMLVGPFGLGLIHDTAAIDFLATLGIILLLFVVGLELDPRKFGKVGSRVLILSTVEFLVAFSVSVLSALSAGWDLGTALFLGSVLGLSSTAIVAKLILDRFPEHDENFTALMMVMVAEDVIAVFLLFLTPELAGGRQLQASGLLFIALKGFFLFLASFGFGRYLGPRLINKVSQYELEIGEVAFLLALSFGFLFGVFSDFLGFSPAIGALLVGFFLPVKQSRYVREKILPLKDAFIVFFFLSMGTLIDTSTALSLGLPLVIILVGAILGKLAGGILGARLARIGRPILVGSILVPRGEFSLVLAKTGVDAGLVGPQLYPVAGLAVLVTALASPLIDRLTRPSHNPPSGWLAQAGLDRFVERTATFRRDS